MTFGRYSQNLGTDVSSMGCYCLGDALFRMQTQISTRISAPLHHYRWGLCCFQSLKTCPVTAAKEVTREEKHGQRRSAIHSSHRCPAACTGRNRPVSSPCPTAEWALQCAGEVKSRPVFRARSTGSRTAMATACWQGEVGHTFSLSSEYNPLTSQGISGKGQIMGEEDGTSNKHKPCSTKHRYISSHSNKFMRLQAVYLLPLTHLNKQANKTIQTKEKTIHFFFPPLVEVNPHSGTPNHCSGFLITG